jgi:hypothetical protein
MGMLRNANKILIGKPEGKRPCRKPMEDNIRMDLMDLRVIRWKMVDWMHRMRIGTSRGIL